MPDCGKCKASIFGETRNNVENIIVHINVREYANIYNTIVIQFESRNNELCNEMEKTM